jgi:high-affinity Fe2+/Pb2+ permease
MLVIISFLLIFILIIIGMVVQAIKAKDNKSKYQIIGRIIGVAALFIGFLFVWIKSK